MPANNTFTWNGEDASGNPLPVRHLHTCGICFRCQRQRSHNDDSRSRHSHFGRQQCSGTTYLTVGGNEIPLSEVDTVGAGSSTSTN